MSDLMKGLDFAQMVRRMVREYREKKSVYNVSKIPVTSEKTAVSLFRESADLPLGVAAGPHTQLAHNILADYAAGARYFELKTVQSLYGEDLGIPKPCIRADDEGYNTEWSSEFHCSLARDEYVRAWFLLKVFSREFGVGNPDGFIFNMSVGYDLEGLKHPDVDEFIRTMSDCCSTEVFYTCRETLYALVREGLFTRVDTAFVDAISSEICRSITLSTMHGCPPDEIESMAAYLIREKGLHTYIKLNPTLLGYEKVREILDATGYDYIRFGREQFEKDLTLDRAIPMLTRLQSLAQACGLDFGVKLTNTFQVEIPHAELPGEAMYMSGKALFPLSIHVADLLAEAFGGKLPMSFSGGADKKNIAALYEAGIWPITVCTVLLRPIGLEAMDGLVKSISEVPAKADRRVDPRAVHALAAQALSDPSFHKTEKARAQYDEHRSYRAPRVDSIRCRVLCKNCIRVCPNRTNEILTLPDGPVILHVDAICNECGNCSFFCVEPCTPYRDRITLFSGRDMLMDSENKGLAVEGDLVLYRWDGKVDEGSYEELPAPIREVLDAIRVQHPYLLC